SDDLPIGAGDANTFADRIHASEVLASDSLVDDGDFDRAGVVVRQKIAPKPDRNAHRFKEAGSYNAEAALCRLSGAFERYSVDIGPTQQWRVGQARGMHAGKCRNALYQIGQKRAAAFRRVATESRIQCSQENVIPAKTRIHSAQIRERAD